MPDSAVDDGADPTPPKKRSPLKRPYDDSGPRIVRNSKGQWESKSPSTKKESKSPSTNAKNQSGQSASSVTLTTSPSPSLTDYSPTRVTPMVEMGRFVTTDKLRSSTYTLSEYPAKRVKQEYPDLKKKTYLVEIRKMKVGDTYFNGSATYAESSESDLIHNAGNTFNKQRLFPVIIGYFTEDDDGNLEYTYYERGF